MVKNKIEIKDCNLLKKMYDELGRKRKYNKYSRVNTE